MIRNCVAESNMFWYYTKERRWIEREVDPGSVCFLVWVALLLKWLISAEIAVTGLWLRFTPVCCRLLFHCKQLVVQFQLWNMLLAEVEFIPLVISQEFKLWKVIALHFLAFIFGEHGLQWVEVAHWASVLSHLEVLETSQDSSLSETNASQQATRYLYCVK